MFPEPFFVAMVSVSVERDMQREAAPLKHCSAGIAALSASQAALTLPREISSGPGESADRLPRWECLPGDPVMSTFAIFGINLGLLLSGFYLRGG